MTNLLTLTTKTVCPPTQRNSLLMKGQSNSQVLICLLFLIDGIKNGVVVGDTILHSGFIEE